MPFKALNWLLGNKHTISAISENVEEDDNAFALLRYCFEELPGEWAHSLCLIDANYVWSSDLIITIFRAWILLIWCLILASFASKVLFGTTGTPITDIISFSNQELEKFVQEVSEAILDILVIFRHLNEPKVFVRNWQYLSNLKLCKEFLAKMSSLYSWNF